MEEKDITDIILPSPCTSTQIYPTVIHTWESGECYTKDSIHTCQMQPVCMSNHLELTPKCFTTFCLLIRPILPVMESKLQKNSIWGHDNPYITLLPVNVWDGVSGDLLIGPYIFLRLTSDICLNFLQISWWNVRSCNEPPAIAMSYTTKLHHMKYTGL